MKISLHIIVLIVRGCFDRTHGLNKLFFALDARALLMLNYNKPSRIFPCILLIFSKTTNCARPKKNLLVLIYPKLHSKSCDYLCK